MELDDVFLNCHDSDLYRMKSCIIGELARIEGALRTLESDCVTAEITITPVSKNVITQASNCIKQAYSFAYSTGQAIKMGVTLCIETLTTTAITTEPDRTTPTTKSTTKPTTTCDSGFAECWEYLKNKIFWKFLWRNRPLCVTVIFLRYNFF